MSAWREVQAAFRAALLADDEAGLDGLVLADGLSAAARLRLYRHHVLSTLTDALRGSYPVVVRLVGDGFFAYAADRYVRDEPPAGPCLFEYGGTFPAFLAAFPPARSLEYLADVARLEWALHAACHAEELPALDPEPLRRLSPAAAARLTFRLHPSVSLLRSPWPVDRIWRANQPGADPDATVDLTAGGARLEVRRLEDEAAFRPLAPAVYAFREALAGGRLLAAAAEAGLAEDPAFDLTLALHDLFRDGLAVGFAVAPPEEAIR
jgi:Putative DNA-binding domain